MSPDQLRSIFHVDAIDSVPDYEIVELIHQLPHHVRKRAIKPNPATLMQSQLLSVMTDKESGISAADIQHESLHHVKKDLSKNAYFSAQKSSSSDSLNSANADSVRVKGGKRAPGLWPVDSGDVRRGNDAFNSNRNAKSNVNNINNNNSNSDDSELSDRPQGVANAWPSSASSSEEGGQPLPQHEHNVSFKAFGQSLRLTLKPTEGLFKNGGPHTLRMWTVKPNPNASQGLDYEEVIEVSRRRRIFAPHFP